MERFDLGNIFQGISTLLQADSAIMYARIGLILLGILLVYLGRRGVLEPLVAMAEAIAVAVKSFRAACTATCFWTPWSRKPTS